jgi:hypothetical protein
MRITDTVCVLLALLSIPTMASAQNTVVSPLAGLHSFAISIENLDEDGARCAVTRTGLYTALRAGLSSSEMDIADDARAGDAVIYLTVTVLPNCAASIALEVRAWVTIRKTGTMVFAPVWERGRLRTGYSGASAGAAIRQSVEDSARLLVADWSSANK